MTFRPVRVAAAILLFLTPAISSYAAQNFYPGKHWRAYVSPEDAGFSSEKLAEARAFYDTTQAAALFVVYRGAVIADWGETARRFRCHSARKSLMSGMYGIHIDNGTIDTNLTLEQLGIDDSPTPLTSQEKQARIADLLAARSGIYLLAAYEPASNPKPPRGSFAPGTNWCYNNWDFNTLLTIFEKVTNTRFFDEFDRQFAKPLQMEDYSPSDGYYHYERDKSIHPAYPFRMSARDMARFGLLYLDLGQWNGKRILSERYVTRSTSRISEGTWTGGYGFLWWSYDAEPFRSLGMYSALGLGEQTIHVIPGADLVFVLRTDTYSNRTVTSNEHMKLVQMFLDAMTGTPRDNPRLIEVSDPPPQFAELPMTDSERRSYVNDYVIDTNWVVKVHERAKELVIENGEGPVPLRKLGPDHFIMEDFQTPIHFESDSSGEGKQLIMMDGLAYTAFNFVNAGKHEEALKTLATAEKYFADDPGLYQYRGDILFSQAGPQIDSAVSSYAKSSQMDRTRTMDRSALAWWLPIVCSKVYLPDTASEHLRRFAGKYGTRMVEFDNGQLYYSRTGRPGRPKLTRLTESIFAVEGSDAFRVMFCTDGNGQVYKLIGMYLDGRRDENMREL